MICTFGRNVLFCALLLSGGVATGLDWNGALITGVTPGGRVFFEPGEEIAFTLKLVGVGEELPPGEYFVDWERRGDDGVRERGRAALPLPTGGLTVKTKGDKPGFICLEANVVTKDGKRVRKDHRWEPRVFFQGGAAVRPDDIPIADAPADYDAFWAAAMKELDAVPIKAQTTQVECGDKAVKCLAVRIPCAGPHPATGYVTIPVAASASNRMPIKLKFMGASTSEQKPPPGGPHDSIWMVVNPNGYELGRGQQYVKDFLASVSEKGYMYGFGPKSNESRHTSYWKYCALRAVRSLQWLKTLPEWDGREIALSGGSQGDWQCFHAAANVSGVTGIVANGSWGCDWTGQAQFGRLKSTFRPPCWFPDMAYFDPVFAARRIACPVDIAVAGLGDYVSTPSSLTLLYRSLRGPKRITYVQGWTHGWRPSEPAPQRFTVDGGYDAAKKGGFFALDVSSYVRDELKAGHRRVVVPKGRYELDAPSGAATCISVEGVDGVEIDFSGSDLVARRRIGVLQLSCCTNVTVRNASVDYANLPFTQALVEKVDGDGSWDVRVIPGYPIPNEDELSSGAVFPIQAYDGRTHELRNPLRFRDGVKIVRTGDDTYRIESGKDRRGAVGDIAVWSIRDKAVPFIGGVVWLRDCAGCMVEDVTVYATPRGACGFYESGAYGNVYRRCALVRRPSDSDFVKRGCRRLRSGDHDAFNSRISDRGPIVDGCTFQYHCDDCVNISGLYAFVIAQRGRELHVVAPYGGAPCIGDGDICQVMRADGTCPPDVSAVSVRELRATTADERAAIGREFLWPGLADRMTRVFSLVIAEDRDVPYGSMVMSERRQGNGFVIRNCTMGRNRARGLLVKASGGLVESNLIERVECEAVHSCPEYEFMEGGCSRNLVVRGNVMVGNGGGVLVSGTNGRHKPLPLGAHSDIEIVDNVISGSWTGVKVVGCTNLVVRGNRIEGLRPNPKRTGPVEVVNSSFR